MTDSQISTSAPQGRNRQRLPEKHRSIKKSQSQTSYKEYADIFSKKKFDTLPERRPWDHEIHLLPGSEQDRKLKGRVYPINATEQIELEKFINENINSGRIRPSKSPIAAPFFFIQKKDAALRPVQDYHRLNAATVKDSYPLPLIQDVLNKVKNAKYFSKFDVRWGFNNVRIKEGDEWKAAFITSMGLFEPLVMFFGLTNSPATFQHMMDNIFIKQVQDLTIIVYMDDILVFTDDLEKHRKVVNEVLELCRLHKLYLKLEKCQFEQTKIDFLGIVIEAGNVTMDPIKTKAVNDWPVPKTLCEVRSFMQFCNFYRAFIPEFAGIMVPFNELTKKDVPFTWGPWQQEAFTKLKEIIKNDVALMLPVPGARYRVETDSSDYAVGAVLHQIIDNKPRPIAFFSKTLQPAERNYQIYDKELLAMMLALQNWWQFLRNGPEFDVWSDHQNLTYFREPQKLSRRQARWAAELAEFNLKLHHRPGKLNIIADILSRTYSPEGGGGGKIR